MNPADLPCARELFAQWQRARGRRTGPASRSFSRPWEQLLEDARLVSGIERTEAERDVRMLETDGWLELKPVRYKPHLIERLVIPLKAEPRWCEAFGFIVLSDSERRQIREFSWEPELAFLHEGRVNLPFAELFKLNQFFKARSARREIVPIKERSLEIFGDEKRLDVLYLSSLFRAGRLELRRDLSCEVIGIPFAWKRGPSVAWERPIIAIENAATWHSYCRWNADRGAFSAIVYGDGNRFVEGIRYLKDLFVELGGIRRILYFGDLDPQGLLIPQEASGRAEAADLPHIEPHVWSYRKLLQIAEGRGQPWQGEPISETLCDWLGEPAEQVQQLFAAGKRIAQEHLGWKVLREVSAMTESMQPG
jgi:hypothetical protein